MPTKFKLLAGLNTAFLLFFSLSLFAQSSITGRVLNNTDKQPVVGATVQAKGGKSATITGQDGSFTLTSNQKVSNIVITIVGYETITVAVKGNDVGDVMLATSTTSLNDVIVTGYTTQKKKDITGAVAIVDVGDAKKITTTSSEQLLQGQAAGVTVINSGAPGAASTVFVRGISNFGNTAPLYVVDGVQVGDMSLVNPNDIESINVLKDAGAAAIYGISGGNGVVVVTTKRGHAGKATITFDGYYGTQQPLSGNPFHLMNPVQQSQLAFTAGDLATQNLYPGGAGVIPTYGFHGGAPVGTFPAAGVTNDPAIEQYYNYDPNNPGNDFLVQKYSQTGTDWFHQVFKPAPTQQYTLSASGGGDKSNYYFAANYINQQGTLLNNYEKRYQVRLNTNFAVKKYVRFGENLFVTYRENNGGYNGTQQQEGGSIAYIFREMPIVPVYDIKGQFGGAYAGPGGEPLGNGSNPFAILSRQSTNNAHFVTAEGNVFAEADIAKYFTVRTSFGGLLYNQYYWGITYTPYEDYESHANPNGANEHEQMTSQYNWTNTITYKESFGLHNVSVLGGYEMKQFSGRYFDAYTQNLFSLDPNYVQLQFGSQANSPATSYIQQPTETQSFFARLDYNYNDRYLLGATVRHDGYSIFFPGKQWGTFPSVSAGWRLSQEDFLKNTSWINNLMLFGSYGIAGNNANIGANNAYSSYASGAGASYYGIGGGISSTLQGFYQNQNGNPGVTWEKDKMTNIGLTANFLNHFDLTVEWWKKAISGLLFTLPLPATVGGANSPVVNVGDVENKGWDISLDYHGRVGKDFTFKVGANITTYQSLITAIPSPGYFDFGYNRDLPIVRNEVGHPIGAFFGFQTMGLYQSDADAAKGATYKGAKAGSFIYKDVNGDGVIDNNDRTWIGNPNPKFTYGINLNASYKGFDFTMILYGSAGNKDYNYVKYWTDFYSTFQGGKNLDLYNKAAVVQGGLVTNPGATLPAASYSQALGSSTTSDFYVEDGSFLKCRVLQIGYTLLPSTVNKIGIDRVRVYVQATNLFTITNYSGLDPELVPSLSNNGNGVNQSAAFGIDYGAYPNNQKQYIIGVNLTF
jgi:TonB-dependent starch-binding outer membrane protein SusC